MAKYASCPVCFVGNMEPRFGEFVFAMPPKCGGGVVEIADATWESCSACGERVIPYDLSNALHAASKNRSTDNG